MGQPSHAWFGLVAAASVALPIPAAAQAELTWASEGRHSEPDLGGGGLGFEVAADGERVAAYDSSSQSVVVFVRVGSSWMVEQRISSPMPNTRFGESLALEADRLLVAAPPISGTGAVGAAYVFARESSGWSLEQELMALMPGPGDLREATVALEGDRCVVRLSLLPLAEPSAYVFARHPTGAWTEEARIVVGGATRPSLGGLALSDSWLFLGWPSQLDASGGNAGAVFAYRWVAGEWVEHERLDPTAVSGAFGSALAVHGDRLVVGDPGPLLPYWRGNVSVREWDGTAWVEQDTLLPSDGGSGAFGFDVGAAPERVAVGHLAHQVDVFREDVSGWVDEATFVPEVSNERYAYRIALTPRLLAVGAYPPFGSSTTGGSIYFYGLRYGIGAPCAGTEDCHTGYCVDGVCCDSECGGGALDDCMVCSVAAGGTEDGVCVAAPVELGIVCRAAIEPCDVPESCDGASVDCPIDAFVAAGAPCREASGLCDAADSCDGLSADCADTFASDGASCDDGTACNGAEVCAAGECASQPALVCEDGDPCTADFCAEPSGCASAPIPGCVDSTVDAGPADAGVGEVVRYGCSCRIAARPRESSPIPLLMVAILVLVCRRRGLRTTSSP